MRRYCIPKPGDIDGLTLVEADVPKPGPGQILAAPQSHRPMRSPVG